jgi:Rieske Fe-S protein
VTRIAPVSRRTALTLGGATASSFALAACASGSRAAPSEGAPPAEPTAVATIADLPVGGTASADLAGTPILLSRPSDGVVKAFSAICTHQGCAVAAEKARFRCPCHESIFDISTGAPREGSPALRPLLQYTVTLDGDTILVSA